MAQDWRDDRIAELEEALAASEARIGVGGVRVDRAISRQLLRAVEPHAVEAALAAAQKVARQSHDRLDAARKELEEATYASQLAQRRHEAVDPARRLVARELERRWEAPLERVRNLEAKVQSLAEEISCAPKIERDHLLCLARDLPRVWNDTAVDTRPKQRIVRTLIQEVVIDVDEASHEAVAVIHWTGGRHTEVRVARNRSLYPKNQGPNPVDAIRSLAPRWSDWQIAVTLNRARCRSSDGHYWTELRVRELRERLRVPPYDPKKSPTTTVSADEAARHLSMCVGSVMRLIRTGRLPATQSVVGAPWEIPIDALSLPATRQGVQESKLVGPRHRSNIKTLRP